MEAHLAKAGGPFLVGGALSLADLVVASHLLMLYIMVWDADLAAAAPGATRLLQAVFTHPTSVAALKATFVPPASPARCVAGATPAWGAGPHPLAAFSAAFDVPWSGNRVRAAFNEFFETKGHTQWASSSVVPHNDPTLLFTNAGAWPPPAARPLPLSAPLAAPAPRSV